MHPTAIFSGRSDSAGGFPGSAGGDARGRQGAPSARESPHGHWREPALEERALE